MISLSDVIAKDFRYGICTVKELKSESYLNEEMDIGLKYAISLAYPLIKTVFDTFDKYPSGVYQNHYRVVNKLLEGEALKTAKYLEDKGYRSLAVPATHSVDPYHGHLSHRMAAMLAGIGWIGRSALLVTPDKGAQLRLITVLTDYPFKVADKCHDFACGECRKCIDICPVKAIGENPREIRREVCYKYLQSLIGRGIVEELICGLCIKVCNGGLGE